MKRINPSKSIQKGYVGGILGVGRWGANNSSNSFTEPSINMQEINMKSEEDPVWKEEGG